jgi:hypothetical protein
VTSSFGWFKNLLLGDKSIVGNIPNAPSLGMVHLQFFTTNSPNPEPSTIYNVKFISQIATTSSAPEKPGRVPTAKEVKPEDGFEFIRDAAKRDNAELLVSKAIIVQMTDNSNSNYRKHIRW